FCFTCVKWVKGGREWENHCSEHLWNLDDPFCGYVTRRGLVVAAARCPFCLGDTAITPSRRFNQFIDPHTYHNHIDMHIKRMFDRNIRCPFPLCDDRFRSKDDFKEHLRHCHGMF
ncbi:hypothetical protein AOQ84DRAFT_250357, partial [Glonium stellatum]